MNNSIKTLCGFAIAPVLLFASTARADGWRCMDEPGQEFCQDALLNDIETTTVARWPGVLTVAMPALPYTCTKAPGSGHQAFPGPITNLVSSMAWWIDWTGAPQSFLLGTSTAAAAWSGSTTARGSRMTTTTVGGSAINYVFAPSSFEVQSPAGPTGVADLGGLVGPPAMSGPFWGSSLQITLDLADGDWTCLIGYPGKTVRATGKNIVHATYPIAWTAASDVFGEAIRNQYRSAVRLVVTGTP